MKQMRFCIVTFQSVAAPLQMLPGSSFPGGCTRNETTRLLGNVLSASLISQRVFCTMDLQSVHLESGGLKTMEWAEHKARRRRFGTG